MQHSRLTWRETGELIRVVAQAGCIPFVRVPNANPGDIQKATDAGALGVIIPMVDTVEEARKAVMYAKWPIGSRNNPNTKPWGHRSSGGGQFPRALGPGLPDQRQQQHPDHDPDREPGGSGRDRQHPR